MSMFLGAGDFFLYIQSILKRMALSPFRLGLVLKQMEFVGVDSLFIISLTGFFTGAVFALQIGGIFSLFRAEGMMGGATGLALASELAPLITGFLLTGRCGSAMASEIATMKVTEQIDAMEAMGVDPVDYLGVPRVWASLLMMPFLAGIFMVVGMVGAYFTGSLIFAVDPGVFIEKLKELVLPWEVVMGLRKMFVFSFLIAAISCRYGLKATQGAKGVGLATTSSVVHTLLVLLLTDFFISYLQIRWAS
jgi:phospholipid/cholesterol/gamma-HCH transport system permease protein